MISYEDFDNLIHDLLKSDLSTNPAQQESVAYSNDRALLLVAGPGSGKTRVLVLRALRHVLVDDILPERILITTFTRKAAKELRTRWLDWGTLFLDAVRENFPVKGLIERIDLNRCRIDTLDSIAQQALTDNRLPNEVAPVILEGSAAKLTFKRYAFREIYRDNTEILGPLLSAFSNQSVRNQGEALSVAKTICDRLVQDQVDLEKYGSTDRARKAIATMVSTYQDYLRASNLFDFVFLEQRFLERIKDDSLITWLNEIQVLLIDEYQDTNPLQEAIYFEIVSKVSPLLTVVGDDDQAMYRFRGGSVELFTQFGQRYNSATEKLAKRIDMVINYRSSAEIVSFYNSYISNDSSFRTARIIPPKPEVISSRGLVGLPVLGLFREDSGKLAVDLAMWLNYLYKNRNVTFGANGQCKLNLTERNDWGDFVFLSHSVEEVSYDSFNTTDKIRFGRQFRDAMEGYGYNVFNPRGRALRTIPSVKQLLGQLLLCLDPRETLTDEVYPTTEAKFFLTAWRSTAKTWVQSNPNPGGLDNFIYQWSQASLGNADSFPADWPVLELVFKLITWMKDFQNDPEHQVWLEAITRIISSAGMASPYGMQIMNNGIHRERSRQSIIRDALIPIAENEVDVDEDIMPSVPRNHLQFMTIHQSKGLEFPFVIVDVGSRFKGNNAKQKFLRFPNEPSNVVRMEDDVEPFLNSTLRKERTPIDRTFDDLIRLYYVAYSRPQSVLMLIGCENGLKYGRENSLTDGAIPNIALGWIRDGSWPWRQTYTGKRPIKINPPLFLI